MAESFGTVVPHKCGGEITKKNDGLVKRYGLSDSLLMIMNLLIVIQNKPHRL